MPVFMNLEQPATAYSLISKAEVLYLLNDVVLGKWYGKKPYANEERITEIKNRITKSAGKGELLHLMPLIDTLNSNVEFPGARV